MEFDGYYDVAGLRANFHCAMSRLIRDQRVGVDGPLHLDTVAVTNAFGKLEEDGSEKRKGAVEPKTAGGTDTSAYAKSFTKMSYLYTLCPL